MPSHKKKSKLWKEQQGKPSRSSEQQKKMKVNRAKKAQEKHRRDAQMHSQAEDFPRGHRQQGCKGSRARRRSLFQALSGSKATCAEQPLEGAKRKKKWKKQRNASPDSRDNLFLIKQRKKSKQKSW